MDYYDENYSRRTNNGTITRIIAIFMLLFAIVFFSAGYYVDKSSKEYVENCTEFIFGEIINIDSKVSKSKDSDGHVTYTTLYRNTYKYTIDGQEYTLEDSSWNNIENEVGGKMAIYYNSDNYEMAMSQRDLETSSILGGIFMFIGAVIFVISLSLNIAVSIIKHRESNRIDEYENYTTRRH